MSAYRTLFSFAVPSIRASCFLSKASRPSHLTTALLVGVGVRGKVGLPLSLVLMLDLDHLELRLSLMKF
jgi:hypothetical protein